MRRLALTLGIGIALAGLGAASAGARLTPVEQRWVVPLLKVYNVENAGLTVVEREERAADALVAGSGRNNATLSRTLVNFVDCPAAVAAAGKPPSARLTSFADDMAASCVHLAAGGNDVGKAIGQIRVGNAKRARSLLVSSLGEFVAGSHLLAGAEKELMAVAGTSPLAA